MFFDLTSESETFGASFKACFDNEFLHFDNTGVEDVLTRKKIQTYPNPTTGMITVEIPEYLFKKDIVLKIVNLTGQIVFNNEYPSARCEIDLNELGTKGVYFVQIADKDERVHDTKMIVLR